MIALIKTALIAAALFGGDPIPGEYVGAASLPLHGVEPACASSAFRAWTVELSFPSEEAKRECHYYGMHQLVYSMSWKEEETKEPYSLIYTVYHLCSPKDNIVAALAKIEKLCPEAQFVSVKVTEVRAENGVPTSIGW